MIKYNLFRGDSVTVQKGNVSASAWMDRKVVMVMSSNCQPAGVGSVLRRLQDGTQLPVTCPEPIISYNEHMGEWIEGTSSENIIPAGQRAGNFTNISLSSCWMWQLPMLSFS